MIQIKDKGDCVEVDNGKEKVTYSCWEEMQKHIDEVKLYKDQGLYIREGNKLYKVRTNAQVHDS